MTDLADMLGVEVAKDPIKWLRVAAYFDRGARQLEVTCPMTGSSEVYAHIEFLRDVEHIAPQDAQQAIMIGSLFPAGSKLFSWTPPFALTPFSHKTRGFRRRVELLNQVNANPQRPRWRSERWIVRFKRSDLAWFLAKSHITPLKGTAQIFPTPHEALLAGATRLEHPFRLIKLADHR